MTIQTIKRGIRNGTPVVGNIYTNPSDGTVLADTGALPAGLYLFSFVYYATIIAIVDIQQRDAANTSNIMRIRTRIAANDMAYPYFPTEVPLLAAERVRLSLVGSIVGDFQGSIFYVPLA